MDRVEAMRVAASDATISDKIRALHAAGYPRAEIARLLGKRYQHVRNVLEGDKLRRTAGVGETPGVAETSRPFEGPYVPRDVEDRGGGAYRLTVRPDGSILLPDAVRAAFGVSGGGSVMARLVGDEFKLISAATAWRRIDELMAPYRWKGGPMASDELIAERRAEAERE
ncbi:MAG: AbrB/MazE/SpoVT family DNA-binding domain-containing protein [Phenylobacterium sp.]|nr:AbrB/MazE/SpoVT family DNA-binding domain-containing protein [Phenylobacterium sp.]